MRFRLILPLLLAAALTGFLLLRSGEPDRTGRGDTNGVPTGATDEGVARLEPVLITAGEVSVSIQPLRVDDEGASFEISFETHSVDLAFDVADVASLEVGGREWTRPAWEGSPPGGHHRGGELSFEAAGPARGEVILSIDGLPQLVEATWTLGG